MTKVIKEFFTLDFERSPEGFLSWQHLLSVTMFLSIAIFSAFFIGNKKKKSDFKTKIKVLKIAGIIMVSLELFKITLGCIRSSNIGNVLGQLPLFLCSIQLIAIPIASFAHGKLQKGMLDFVFIFGLLGALLGTYGAGNLYSYYPVVHFDTMVSAATHSIAGFCSLYIVISGLICMEKELLPIPYFTLFSFEVVAFIVNLLQNNRYNYMFLNRPDGTPFTIVYNLINGNQILYTLIVVLLMLLYIFLFQLIYGLITKKRKELI